jgi:hypothetical protein
MTERLVGKVVRQDVPDLPIDLIGLGTHAFSQRAEIKALWNDIAPIVDVVKLQLPAIIARARSLIASFAPNMQIKFGLTGAVAEWTITDVQQGLKDLDRYHDKVDGIHGHNSRAAVKQFQIDKGMASPDGWPGKQTCGWISHDLIEAGKW